MLGAGVSHETLSQRPVQATMAADSDEDEFTISYHGDKGQAGQLSSRMVAFSTADNSHI